MNKCLYHHQILTYRIFWVTFPWILNMGFFVCFFLILSSSEWQQCYRLCTKGRGSHQFWLSWFLLKFIINKWMKKKKRRSISNVDSGSFCCWSIKWFPLRRLDERIIVYELSQMANVIRIVVVNTYVLRVSYVKWFLWSR